MERTSSPIDVWTENLDAQDAVRSTAMPADEYTFDTEPRQLPVDDFPDMPETAMIQAILRPEFSYGVQVLQPNLQRAPIELKVFGNEPDTSETIAVVQPEHIVVSGKLFGLASEDNPLRIIRLNSSGMTDQETAALEHVNKLLLNCAGLENPKTPALY